MDMDVRGLRLVADRQPGGAKAGAGEGHSLVAPREIPGVVPLFREVLQDLDGRRRQLEVLGAGLPGGLVVPDQGVTFSQVRVPVPPEGQDLGDPAGAEGGHLHRGQGPGAQAALQSLEGLPEAHQLVHLHVAHPGLLLEAGDVLAGVRPLRPEAPQLRLGAYAAQDRQGPVGGHLAAAVPGGDPRVPLRHLVPGEVLDGDLPQFRADVDPDAVGVVQLGLRLQLLGHVFELEAVQDLVEGRAAMGRLEEGQGRVDALVPLVPVLPGELAGPAQGQVLEVRQLQPAELRAAAAHAVGIEVGLRAALGHPECQARGGRIAEGPGHRPGPEGGKRLLVPLDLRFFDLCHAAAPGIPI